MTNPLLRFHQHVWRTIGSTVDSLRRQAPGARMIGEFAVKHAVNEAQRRLQPPEQDDKSSELSGEQQP